MLEKIHVNNGWIIFMENFISLEKSDFYFDYFLNTIPWKSSKIKVFGKTYDTPRREAYFANSGKNYSYSGKSLVVNTWDEELIKLRDQLSEILGEDFNACLLNLYRDGQDSNGWHADNEKELGKNPIIASLSFGATRKFQLKHSKNSEKYDFNLSHGALIVMGGELQHFWKHQIPKQKKIADARINLTFRKIV